MRSLFDMLHIGLHRTAQPVVTLRRKRPSCGTPARKIRVEFREIHGPRLASFALLQPAQVAAFVSAARARGAAITAIEGY